MDEFFRVNVDGAVHVMNEAIDSGATSFTHISTGNVLLGSPHLNSCDEVMKTTQTFRHRYTTPHIQSKMTAPI